MRRAIVALVALFILVGMVPVANAGPGGAICRASSNLYERATGRDAPWNCTY